MKLSARLLTPIFLFAVANLLMGLYKGLYDPSFNNYLSQVHHLSATARGGLEFPRELPGFLVVFVFALLAFLRDTRIAALAATLVGISLIGQGYLTPNFILVVFWMLIWSAGSHLFTVLKSSIVLRIAEEGHTGRLFGHINSMENWGKLMGMIFVWWGVSRFSFSFATIFGIAGCIALIAAISLVLIKPQPLKAPKHLVLKRKYMLFYILNLLYGARKQIYLTFAPWVLIRIYDQGVETFALLGIALTVISLFFFPLVGRAIDVLGEKVVMILESIFMFIICMLYGFSGDWFSNQTAQIVTMACFVADQLLVAANMSRPTYLNRIADSPEDIGPTISMGLTFDHVVAMTIPFWGGLLWVYAGYQWVFLAAGLITLMNLVAALYVPGLQRASQDAIKNLNA